MGAVRNLRCIQCIYLGITADFYKLYDESFARILYLVCNSLLIKDRGIYLCDGTKNEAELRNWLDAATYELASVCCVPCALVPCTLETVFFERS